jgi:hypothetical protein
MATAQDVIDALANLKNAVFELSKRTSQPNGSGSGEQLWRHARQLALGRRGLAGHALFKGNKQLAFGRARSGVRRIKIGGRRAPRFGLNSRAQVSGRQLAGLGDAEPFAATSTRSMASWASTNAAAVFIKALHTQSGSGSDGGAAGFCFGGAASEEVSPASGSVSASLGKQLFAYGQADGKQFWAPSLRRQLEEAVQQASKDAVATLVDSIDSQTNGDRESPGISEWIRQAAEIDKDNRKRADDRIRAMRERRGRV